MMLKKRIKNNYKNNLLSFKIINAITANLNIFAINAFLAFLVLFLLPKKRVALKKRKKKELPVKRNKRKKSIH